MKMDKNEEKNLVERARKDPQAFGEIFDMYYDAIFGYVLRRVGNVQISQDITSEVFFRAMDRLWQFKWRDISISAWLYRIAMNEISQYFRGNKRKVFSLDALFENEGFDVSDEIDIFEELINKEREIADKKRWKEIREALEILPIKYQEVLALRFFENKKICEISEILGKKEGTVKSLLHRGTSILRKNLSKNAT